MPETTTLSFCPACQEIFAPKQPACPACQHDTVETSLDLPDSDVELLATAVREHGVATLWLRDDVAQVSLIAELLLRANHAA